MTSTTGHQHQALCLRCGRPLRAVRSVSDGFGRWCKARVREAAGTADLSAFHGWQIDKAREAIEQQAIVPSSRKGLYAAVSGDGTTVYLVDAIEVSCTCKAGANGRSCYHLAGALILWASAPARKAA